MSYLLCVNYASIKLFMFVFEIIKEKSKEKER